MRAEKLMSAGMKAGGAAASGFCAAVLFMAGGERLTNGGLAIVGGLGVSSAVLAKQAVVDIVDAFRTQEEE